MQNNAIIRLCGVSALVLLWAITILPAQELRENERGEKIIVYPDGTWQYFSDFSSGAGNADDPSKTPASTDQGNRFPIFVGRVNAMESPISVTEEDIFKIAVRRKQLAQNAAGIAEQRAAEATKARVKIENELNTLLGKNNPSGEEVRQLNIRLNAARKVESETAAEAKRAVGEVSKAEEMTQKGKYIADFKNSQKQKKEASKGGLAQKDLSARPFETLIPLSDNTLNASRENDLILHPPKLPCKIVYEGKDETTGDHRRDVQKQLLFTHTDDRLRVFLRDKEYLRCEGFFTALGGYRFLTLQFTFAYPNAREAYGFIEKGSILTIKLLDGNFINLRAGKMDRGSYDTEREVLTYRVHYPIDRGQMGLLKESEVDTILVFWSTGYEEYEVYQLDFFINQISCLEKS